MLWGHCGFLAWRWMGSHRPNTQLDVFFFPFRVLLLPPPSLAPGFQHDHRRFPTKDSNCLGQRFYKNTPPVLAWAERPSPARSPTSSCPSLFLGHNPALDSRQRTTAILPHPLAPRTLTHYCSPLRHSPSPQFAAIWRNNRHVGRYLPDPKYPTPAGFASDRPTVTVVAWRSFG